MEITYKTIEEVHQPRVSLTLVSLLIVSYQIEVPTLEYRKIFIGAEILDFADEITRHRVLGWTIHV
jgi:hypothetical protein